MIQYQEEIGICKRAHLVFTKQDSFTLYLEFKFGEGHGTGFYLSSYAQVDEIRRMLNKDKTGMAQESIDDNDLKELAGMKAKILTAGLGTKCIFKGFMEQEVITK